MGKIRVSIDLQATPQRVWEVVEPVERHIDWMADAVAIRFIGEQTRDVGTSFFCDSYTLFVTYEKNRPLKTSL